MYNPKRPSLDYIVTLTTIIMDHILPCDYALNSK